VEDVRNSSTPKEISSKEEKETNGEKTMEMWRPDIPRGSEKTLVGGFHNKN